MKIEFTPEQLALQQEVHAYMKTIMTPELREEMKNPEYFEGYVDPLHGRGWSLRADRLRDR